MGAKTLFRWENCRRDTKKVQASTSIGNEVSITLVPRSPVSATLVLRMARRKWKESKQQPSMLPGPVVPGFSFLSISFGLS